MLRALTGFHETMIGTMNGRLILRIVSTVLVIFVWLMAGLIFGLAGEDSPVLALIIFFAGTWLTWAVVQATGDYRRRRRLASRS